MDPFLYQEDGITKVVGVDNISFAIKFDIIEEFLKANEIYINPVLQETKDLHKVIPLNKISTEAEKFTVPVLCFKNIYSKSFPVVQMDIDYWKH